MSNTQTDTPFFNINSSMVPKSERRFIRLNLITIVVTLLLILAGGIVRSTGSGMGCPDWPKCFGQYVPPTSASQLPAGYEQILVAKRVEKNERFARTLEKLGKVELANKIREDKSIIQPSTFNAAQTWTEYGNRLMGALTGFFLLALVILSFTYRRTAKRIIVLSVANLIVVGFQAWLGSIVVSTNLLAWVVTVHMLLALVILAILVYTYNYTNQLRRESITVIARVFWLRMLILTSIVVSVIQIVYGTEVREHIDFISRGLTGGMRSTWVEKVGEIFNYHRNLAVVVAVLNVFVYKLIMDKFGGKDTEIRVGGSVMIVLIVQIATGILLSNFALPPYAQALHILFSTTLFTLQFYLYLLVYRTNTYNQ
jgi:cytochrome c oxidase assembly protein subunit 15